MGVETATASGRYPHPNPPPKKGEGNCVAGVYTNAEVSDLGYNGRYLATVAPTVESHSLAITSLAAFCSSRVGNFALA